MPQATALRNNYQEGEGKNDLPPCFPIFRGWADQWDILKDELRAIAAVSFLNCTLHVPTLIRQCIISRNSAAELYTLFWN